jgi:hypothetical protein
MVTAFVIPADCQQVEIEQLALLAPAKSMVVESEPLSAESVKEAATPTDLVNIDELFDRLSAHATADIARQLLPLSQQIATVATIVDRHERMLEVRSSATVIAPPPVEPTAKKEKTKTTPTSRKITKQQPAQVL